MVNKEALHLGMRLPTLCFWSLEPRKFKRRIKDIAEVDATGKYIPSVGVQRACYALMHTVRAYIYTDCVGVSLCSVHSTGFPRTITTDRRRTDTPLSFL